MGLFLLLFSQALSFSATVCEQVGFAGQACKTKNISCDNLEARFPEDEVKYYKLREQMESEFRTPLKEAAEGNVTMGTFAFSRKGDRELQSKGYVTCSAVALAQADCDHASLSHFINVRPDILLSTQKKAFEENCKNSKGKPQVTLMLSSRIDKREGLNPLKADGYYYYKLICETLKAFPDADVRIVHSKKNTSVEHDNITVKRDGKGEYTLLLDRISGKNDTLIQREKFDLNRVTSSAKKASGTGGMGETGSGL